MKSKSWDFWVIVGFMVANLAILVTIVGFMMSMSARIDSMVINMATKADIARLEANIATKADKADVARVELDVRDIRILLIDHIKDGHKHRKQTRKPASKPDLRG